MRSAAAALLFSALLPLTVGAATSRAADDAPLTLEQYRQQLSQLATDLDKSAEISKADARTLSGSLPVSLKVSADGKEYEVSLYFLHDALAKAEAGDKEWPQARQQAQAMIAALLQESAATAVEHKDAHARADAILSSREYRAEHGPTAWDRLKARIADWLSSLLLRILGRIGRSNKTAYVIYGLAILVLLIFAGWIWRMLPRAQPEPALALRSPSVSTKHWSEWLREARFAADQGNWREGIHLAYWAGISFLESNGYWRPDRARTPREYLRLMPAATGESGILQSMTREFERAWYAQQSAGETEFGRMLHQLDALRAMHDCAARTEPAAKMKATPTVEAEP